MRSGGCARFVNFGEYVMSRILRIGRFVLLGCLVLGVTVAVSPAQAALVAQYNLNGNANDSVGTFHGTVNGGPTFVASPVGGQAINLSFAGQYIDTAASGGTASNLGIGGANPKSISGWARTQAFNDAGIWDLGLHGTDNENFSLRTLGGQNDRWRAQFWGGGDFDFTVPGSLNRWGHFALTYDGTTAVAYFNGLEMGRRTVALNTNNGRSLEIGRWAGGNYFQGQIDNVAVYTHALTASEVRAQYLAAGGYSEGFDGSTQAPPGWYVSSGINTIRPTSEDGPDGTYGLRTSGGTGSPTISSNVYQPAWDDQTGMAWGPAFRVNDPTASIAFKIGGGSHGYVPGSQDNGGVGVALWDVEANQIIPSTFVTRSSNGATYEVQSIPLTGLEGKTLTVVVVDRQKGGWAWTGVDSINTTPGAISLLSGAYQKVYLDYGFDNALDWMGWQQIDLNTGLPVAITSFTLGNTPGGLLARHINSKGVFTVGEGFITSARPDNWDGPQGILRSPTFTLQGDIIEFYISGGTDPSMGFELWVDMDGTGNYTLQRSSRHAVNDGALDYDFWMIRSLAGKSAYLQLRDEYSGGWAWLTVDGIRMVGLAVVPEPSTIALASMGGLALLGLALRRGRRVRR